MVLEIDFRANESSEPERVGEVGMVEEINLAEVIGSPQEDNASVGVGLQIERPRSGEGMAGWPGLEELAMPMTGSGDVSS